MRHAFRRTLRVLEVVLACSIVALAACAPGTSSEPKSSSGATQGMYGEYFLLGVFRPTGGYIKSTDGRIDCGVDAHALCGNAQGQTRYAWSETAVLDAYPAPNYRFDGWAGDCTGKGQCIISTATKRADSHVVAVFVPDAEYRGVYFVVTIDRPVGGTVRADTRIDCGTAGSTSTRCGNALYPWNGSVTLTATPDDAYVFQEWTGACAGVEGPTCTLENVTLDKTIGALFRSAAELPPLAWDAKGGKWDEVKWQ